MYDDLWFVCYHFVTLTRWIGGWIVYQCTQPSCSWLLCGTFFFVHSVSLLLDCAYCVVAKSLTFSTINCILICMGIYIIMAWAGILLFYHYYILRMGWMKKKPWNETFHQLLNENQKLFLKCDVCAGYTRLYLCLYKCMHACLCVHIFSPRTKSHTIHLKTISFGFHTQKDDEN